MDLAETGRDARCVAGLVGFMINADVPVATMSSKQRPDAAV